MNRMRCISCMHVMHCISCTRNPAYLGYIVSDCGAVAFIQTRHNYTASPPETCHAVLNAGVDIECFAYGPGFLTQHLGQAVNDEAVTESMLETALSNGFRVLMRLGYFEKNTTRPYTDLLPSIVDSPAHRQLALEAARQSIVLVKNSLVGRSSSLEVLPFDNLELAKRQSSMALIGPHLNASQAFLANYFGVPSSISTPLEAIRSKYSPSVQHEFGCDIISFENSRLQEAAALAATSYPVILFVGIDASRIEHEERDRENLTLPGLQSELIQLVAAAASDPVTLVVVSGGVVDLEEWKNNPKIGAIIWAGYLGQSGGEAIADVIFGTYNPSGRLPQTFYANEIVNQLEKGDMNMRPVDGSPGRTYRFFTGQLVYDFGHGLSYTTFDYNILDQIAPKNQEECALIVNLLVTNSGPRAGDHSVLWFLAPPNAGQMGRPIKSLLDFEKLENILPGEGRDVSLCLNRDNFRLASEGGELIVVTGEWKLQVGNVEKTILVLSESIFMGE